MDSVTTNDDFVATVEDQSTFGIHKVVQDATSSLENLFFQFAKGLSETLGEQYFAADFALDYASNGIVDSVAMAFAKNSDADVAASVDAVALATGKGVDEQINFVADNHWMDFGKGSQDVAISTDQTLFDFGRIVSDILQVSYYAEDYADPTYAQIFAAVQDFVTMAVGKAMGDDPVSSVDQIAQQVNKVLQDAISAADTPNVLLSNNGSLSETPDATDGMVFDVGRVVNDILQIVYYAEDYTDPTYSEITSALTDIIAMATAKALNDQLSPATDTTAIGTSKAVDDYVTTSDSIGSAGAVGRADTTTASDQLTFVAGFSRQIDDQLASFYYAEDYTDPTYSEFVSGVSDQFGALTGRNSDTDGTNPTTDSAVMATGKSVADSVDTSSDVASFSTTKALYDSTIAIDALDSSSYTISYGRQVDDIVGNSYFIADYADPSYGVVISAVSDTMTLSTNNGSANDGSTMTDGTTMSFAKQIVDSTASVDSTAMASSTNPTGDSSTSIDVTVMAFQKQIADIVSPTDSVTPAFNSVQVGSDTSPPTDSLALNTSKQLQDAATSTDAPSMATTRPLSDMSYAAYFAADYVDVTYSTKDTATDSGTVVLTLAAGGTVTRNF